MLSDVLGHPQQPVLAWVEQDPVCAQGPPQWRVRVLSLPDLDEGVVIHKDTLPLQLAGWWAADVLAVIRGNPTPSQWPETILVPVGDHQTGGSPPASTPAAISWVDYACDGRVVMTTWGPRPTAWRGYRGGGAGRIIVHHPQQGRSFALPGTGNAADAVVLGRRVFWIDDLCGPADIWSLALDEHRPGTPVRHRSFDGAGPTSLRRAAEGLVVESLGKVWTLTPSRDGARDHWRSVSPDDGSILRRFAAPDQDQTPVPARPERVLTGPGDEVAVLSGGAVTVMGDTGAQWYEAAGDRWIVDAAWHATGRLLTLEHGEDACVVVLHGARNQARQILSGDRAVSVERIAHSGGTTVISGEGLGVLAYRDGAAPRWLEERPAYRRSRTTVSPDGSLVAWTQDDDLQGADLIVHDLHTEESAVLSVAGTHLWSPVFDAEGGLVVLARRVSTEGGTAAPMKAGRVCRTASHSPLADLRRGRMSVIRTGPAPLHELAIVNGTAWVRGSFGRWSPAHEDRAEAVLGEGAPLPGSDIPAEILPGGVLGILDREGRSRKISPVSPPPDAIQVVAEAIRLVRRSAALVGAPGGVVGSTTALDDTAWKADLLGAAERASSVEEIAQVVEAAAGRAGLSHAVVFREQDHPPGRDLSEALMERAADVLGDSVVYTALSDVSVPGWRTVQGLIRTWRSDRPLVIDLRFNEGGQFADALASELTAFLLRSADATVAGRGRRPLLSRPPATAILVGEHTGSGGEHLAAALGLVPGVTLWGRRTAGAGTGFHRTRPLGRGLRIALPQYRLGGPGRDGIENHGVMPDVLVPADHAAGIHFDDLLLRRVADQLVGAADAALPRGGENQ